MKILITGVAGFIGFHLANLLLQNNFKVLGVDNINSFYDEDLKLSRLKMLNNVNFQFFKVDIQNKIDLRNIFKSEKPEIVINLAAQAGVRYSLENPSSYISSNIIGFFNILENCKEFKITKLIFASSSSVYGNNLTKKSSESEKVDEPLNLYAATKKSNELMAYAYSNLYNLNCIGLRFFTVYGPWGRPDMAYFKFTKNILEGKSIDVYGNGEMYRDFTYIDDITDAILKLINKKGINSNSILDNNPLFNLFNIGNNNPKSLNFFISIIEKSLNKSAIKNFMHIQPGEVLRTAADITSIKNYIDYKPSTNLETGIPKFIKWYKDFYN